MRLCILVWFAAGLLAWGKEPMVRTLDAQQFIVQELAAGREVDVGRNVTSELSDVSGEFLKNLLTGTNKVPNQGIWITGAVITNDLDLRNAVVKSDVMLVGCNFNGAVLLNGCEFEKGLTLLGCEFKGRFSAAQLQVKRTLDFSSRYLPESPDQPMSDQPTNGPYMNLFYEEETTLTPSSLGTNLVRRVRRAPGHIYWKVNGSFYLYRPTTFWTNADFELAEIGGKLSGDGADFKAKANFKGTKVGGTFWLENAVFRSGAEFAYMKVADQFSIQEASFMGTQEINFYQFTCGGLANLDGVSFGGPANFIQTSIKGNLMAEHAWFLHTNSLAESPESISHYNADFGSLRVDGFAFFTGTEFRGEVSFRNARFTSVFFDEVIWPNHLGRGNTVRLEWMRYDRIRVSNSFQKSETNRSDLQWDQNHDETWDNLRPMLARYSPYSADVYATLEQFFQRDGDEKLARDVFYESKEQEREKVIKQHLHETGEPLEKCRAFAMIAGNYIFKIVVGHGRHPEWALGWSVVIIALGCRVFRLENMEPDGAWKRENPLPKPRLWVDRIGECLGIRSRHQGYYALWYSLDAFVPLIELDSNKGWRPRPNNRLAWNYLIYHRVAGAILVPIGFAAFSGIIK